jgi:hypothetical protein
MASPTSINSPSNTGGHLASILSIRAHVSSREAGSVVEADNRADNQIRPEAPRGPKRADGEHRVQHVHYQGRHAAHTFPSCSEVVEVDNLRLDSCPRVPKPWAGARRGDPINFWAAG